MLSMCKSLNSNLKQYCTYSAIVRVQRKTKSVFDFHGTQQSAQRFSFYCFFPLTNRNMLINVRIKLMQKAFNNLEQNIKYFISSSMANQTSMTEGKAKVEAYYADN